MQHRKLICVSKPWRDKQRQIAKMGKAGNDVTLHTESKSFHFQTTGTFVNRKIIISEASDNTTYQTKKN